MQTVRVEAQHPINAFSISRGVRLNSFCDCVWDVVVVPGRDLVNLVEKMQPSITNRLTFDDCGSHHLPLLYFLSPAAAP